MAHTEPAPDLSRLPAGAKRAPWYRLPLCMAGMCHTFRFVSDDGGCWGECSVCEKRVGYVSRAKLRQYADNEAAGRQARDTLKEQADDR